VILFLAGPLNAPPYLFYFPTKNTMPHRVAVDQDSSSHVSDDVEESESGFSTGTGSSFSECSVSSSSNLTAIEVDEEAVVADDVKRQIQPNEAIEPRTVATEKGGHNMTRQQGRETTINDFVSSQVQGNDKETEHKHEIEITKTDLKSGSAIGGIPPIQQSLHSDKNSKILLRPPSLDDDVARTIDTPCTSQSSRNTVAAVTAESVLDNSTNLPTPKKWFAPFFWNRRGCDPQPSYQSANHGPDESDSNHVHEELPEYQEPTNYAQMTIGSIPTPKNVSPGRTASISDSAATTPDRIILRNDIKNDNPNTLLAGVRFVDDRTNVLTTVASRSPSEHHHHTNKESILERQQEDRTMLSSGHMAATDRTFTFSIRFLLYILLMMVLTICLSTIGTSYLGAELALRGRIVGPMESNPIPSWNDTTTTAAPIPSDNMVVAEPPPSVIAPIPYAPCEDNSLLLSFEIVFDSKPAEVGVSLLERSNITTTNTALWSLDALSFRSFTQFQRKNIFSVCLSNDSNYELEITDTSSNGLVSVFGASTLVYGNWSILLNSRMVANYFGDCTASSAMSDSKMDSGAPSSIILACGEYCRCLFNISALAISLGGCEVECT
jgi:hypothetical protein